MWQTEGKKFRVKKIGNTYLLQEVSEGQFGYEISYLIEIMNA